MCQVCLDSGMRAIHEIPPPEQRRRTNGATRFGLRGLALVTGGHGHGPGHAHGLRSVSGARS